MSGVYDAMSMTELFTAYITNMRVIAGAMKEILGDAPMPDPRELADIIANMPVEAWTSQFEDPEARAYLKGQMDLIKVVAEVQTENAAILDAALNK